MFKNLFYVLMLLGGKIASNIYINLDKLLVCFLQVHFLNNNMFKRFNCT